MGLESLAYELLVEIGKYGTGHDLLNLREVRNGYL